MIFSSLHNSGGISTLGVGFVGILMYHSVSALLHLREFITSRSLGVEFHHYPWQYHVSYLFPSALVPTGLSKLLAEYGTG